MFKLFARGTMDTDGQMIAAFLLPVADTIASRSSAVIWERAGPEQRTGCSFQQLRADVEGWMRCLCESLAVGRAELFALELAWTRAAFLARGLDPALLGLALSGLGEELARSVPPDEQPRVMRHLEQGLAALERAVREDDAARDIALSLPAQRVLRAILEGRAQAALDSILEEQARGATLAQLHEQLVLPVLTEIGRRWLSGAASVADEHCGSRVMEDALTLTRHRAVHAPRNGRRALVACVSGNLHAIGARMVADQLEVAGWQTTFLGADSPAPDIASAARALRADVVVISARLVRHVTQVADAVAALRAAGHAGPVLVGGGPFAHVEGLHRDVGADASVRSASEVPPRALELLSRRA